ncbi:hypothetical protein NLK61_02920 [Pseudomonas fuscovaginae UPB0736]|uniref:hypothetical protein n=1 Tax=Pseudomonas asplenii TaxID=53407 RepID=UPI0004940ED4|nr:hypothetical protein [Pseudomonas fuscovaginae]UUQ65623.1 hypothetical protein NLK61_02920 [Pseudomonas fuscovaginae UPB0736]
MRRLVLMAILSSAITGGCSSMPSLPSMPMAMGDDKFSESYVASHILKGKTTLAEVANLYGEPDSKSNYSDGSSSVIYRKRTARDNLTSLYNLVGTIPGTDSAKSALAQASNKTYDLDKANNSIKELSGNKGHDSNYLSVTFDKNGVVKSWSQ